MALALSLEIRSVAEEDYTTVVSLWEACALVVSYTPPLADLAFAAGRPGSDVLVGVLDGELMASVMVWHDGHRGWIYYVAVHPRFQQRGYGATMVEAAESWLRERGIRTLQLLVRETNTGVLTFYERLGYERSGVVVMQRWLDGTRKGS